MLQIKTMIHRLPQDLLLRKQWIFAMRRENFKPSKHARICSKHFTPDSFITCPWSSNKRLRSDAVPSIFNFPSHLIKKIVIRRPPVSRHRPEENIIKNEDTTIKTTNKKKSREASLEPSAKKRRVCYVGDFKEHNSLNLHQQYRLTVNNVLLKSRKRIKILQQRNRRLIKKVSDLKSLLAHLRHQRMIDEDSLLKLSVSKMEHKSCALLILIA